MDNLCGICLENTNDKLDYILKCNHAFHSNCIDEWFKYSDTCPYCRNDIELSFRGFLEKNFKTNMHIVLTDKCFDFIYPNFIYKIPYTKMHKIYFFKDNIKFEIKHKTFKIVYISIFIKSNILLKDLELKMKKKLKKYLIDFY